MEILFNYLSCTGQSLVIDAHSSFSVGSFDTSLATLKKYTSTCKSADCCGLALSQAVLSCIFLLKDETPRVEPSIKSFETHLRRVQNYSRSRDAFLAEMVVGGGSSGGVTGSGGSSGSSPTSSGGGEDAPDKLASHFHALAYTKFSSEAMALVSRTLQQLLRWLKDYRALYGSDQHHKLLASADVIRCAARYLYETQISGSIGVNVAVYSWLRGVLQNCIATVQELSTDQRYIRQRDLYDELYKHNAKLPSPLFSKHPYKTEAPFVLHEVECLAYFLLAFPLVLQPTGKLPYIIILMKALSQLVQAEIFLCLFKDGSCLNSLLEVHKAATRLEKKINRTERDMDELFISMKQHVVSMVFLSAFHHRSNFADSYPELARILEKNATSSSDAVPYDLLQQKTEETLLGCFDLQQQAHTYSGFPEPAMKLKRRRLLNTIVERCREGLRRTVPANFKSQRLSITCSDGRMAASLECIKGGALSVQNRRAEALASFRQALAHDPFMIEAMASLASLYLGPQFTTQRGRDYNTLGLPYESGIKSNPSPSYAERQLLVNEQSAELVHKVDYKKLLECRAVEADDDDDWHSDCFPFSLAHGVHGCLSQQSDDFDRVLTLDQNIQTYRLRMKFAQGLQAVALYPRDTEFKPNVLSMPKWACFVQPSESDEIAGKVNRSLPWDPSEVNEKETLVKTISSWQKELFKAEGSVGTSLEVLEDEFATVQEEKTALAERIKQEDKNKKQIDGQLASAKEKCAAREKEYKTAQDQKKKASVKATSQRDSEVSKLSKEIQSEQNKEKQLKKKRADKLKNTNSQEAKAQNALNDVSALIAKLEEEAAAVASELDEFDQEYADEIELLKEKQREREAREAAEEEERLRTQQERLKKGSKKDHHKSAKNDGGKGNSPAPTPPTVSSNGKTWGEKSPSSAIHDERTRGAPKSPASPHQPNSRSSRGNVGPMEKKKQPVTSTPATTVTSAGKKTSDPESPSSVPAPRSANPVKRTRGGRF